MGCSINKKLSSSKQTTNTKITNDNFEEYLKSVGSLAESHELRKAKVSYQLQKNPIIQRRMNKSREKLDEICQDKIFLN
ncbi:unnamed protein product (macronuclear) [Paramecium tetraurelia]|uniref:Uncharacterized protein n=1 Tax=Paramecium tetraurelia TaxID=5888 RepID=A0DSW4_PARTE|nr:uncharacterized protein GSPATT00019824001 [Paramecium tetraurelia]CAK86131.1 unnamed protein product [Paramecium tetraurelia]|eukprot:XP_001453528.1 hypothetical protein (macronuclear) [Paramecium tetraurelia strain d4-2]